ncbi:MAG TPA: cyclic nucleotide-binding domain-containing protein [Solirubrobacterales bacterium]|nr:cyclic nucleotide-binding domain-containing protein [Solirubrobacterales bacterium]
MHGARELKLVLRALTVDLDNRDLTLLGLARLAVSFASWSFTIALGVYGFEAHGAVGVGLVAVIRLLPGALASPFAGILSDRYPRRAVMLWSSAAMAVVMAGATVAAALDAPSGVVFVFPALFAIVASGYAPAESALSPVLARTPQELSAGNVTHAALDTGGFLLASLLTGLLLTSSSTGVIFGVAAAALLFAAIALSQVPADRRPEWAGGDDEIAGAARKIGAGLTALKEHPGTRLAMAVMIALIFFEGFADVLVVVMALHELHLEEGSVGFLNAAWGAGALLGGAALALVLDRGRLVIAIAAGSLVAGAGIVLPGAWEVAVAAYIGWAVVGGGYNFAEVAAKTLLQRLSSDETLGRVLSTMESGRLAGMALGSIGATVIVELLDVRAALFILGALLPVFVFVCWTRLRRFEIGAPVSEEHYQLLRENSIFAPLPIATVERLIGDLVPVEAPAREDVIVQGEAGDRFYLIESGQVEVFENGEFRRNEGPGESFGEIALLREVPRTATVRTTEATRLLVLERDQFLGAVTGHRRSHQLAHTVVDDRWASQEMTAPSAD